MRYGAVLGIGGGSLFGGNTLEDAVIELTEKSPGSGVWGIQQGSAGFIEVPLGVSFEVARIGGVSFSSEDKEEVRLWALGVLCAFRSFAEHCRKTSIAYLGNDPFGKYQHA